MDIAARQAGDIALRYWNTGLKAETKSDASPVTLADRECERAIAHALEEAFPDDGLLCVNQFSTIRRYGFSEGLLEWMAQFWAVRSMGGCLDAMMVARGQADLWIETSGKPWDFAPLKIIAEEAGAKFFNFDGGSTIYGGNGGICAPGMEAGGRPVVNAGLSLGCTGGGGLPPGLPPSLRRAGPVNRSDAF